MANCMPFAWLPPVTSWYCTRSGTVIESSNVTGSVWSTVYVKANRRIRKVTSNRDAKGMLIWGKHCWRRNPRLYLSVDEAEVHHNQTSVACFEGQNGDTIHIYADFFTLELRKTFKRTGSETRRHWNAQIVGGVFPLFLSCGSSHRSQDEIHDMRNWDFFTGHTESQVDSRWPSLRRVLVPLFVRE